MSSAVTWTYSINGTMGTVPLIMVSRTQINQQAGQVIMRRNVRPGTAMLMQARDHVIIWRNGIKWWDGFANDPADAPSSQGGQQLYTITDHFRTLEDVDHWIGASPGVYPDPSWYPTIPTLSTSTLQTWYEWLVPQWNITTGTLFDFPAWPASLTPLPTNEIPVGSGKVADQIRALFRDYLRLGAAWDYTSNTLPRLQIRAPGDRLVTFQQGVLPLAEVSASQNKHLQPLALHWRFTPQVSPLYPSAAFTPEAGTQGRWPDGSPPRAYGTLTVFSPPNTDTVGYYYSGQSEFSFNTLTSPMWKGRITLRSRHCDSGVQPGDTLNITGGRAELATMAAVVISVDEQLLEGETTIELGLNGQNDALTAEHVFLNWAQRGQWRRVKLPRFR